MIYIAGWCPPCTQLCAWVGAGAAVLISYDISCCSLPLTNIAALGDHNGLSVLMPELAALCHRCSLNWVGGVLEKSSCNVQVITAVDWQLAAGVYLGQNGSCTAAPNASAACLTFITAECSNAMPTVWWVQLCDR